MHLTYRIIITGMGILFLTKSVRAAEDDTNNIVNLALDTDLLSTVSTALPEGSAVGAEFLNPIYSPNIRLSEDAHVGLTFINEGAGYRNSLGYFTFNDDTFNDLSFGSLDMDASGNISIDELSNINGIQTGMVFENVSKTGSGGSLTAGDTVVLGGGNINVPGVDDSFIMEGQSFSAGTNVGFFLSQNAWTSRGVKGIDRKGDPLNLYSVDFLNPENDPFATFDNVDENSRHVAMMFSDQSQQELILGFEDLHRTDSSQNNYGYVSDEDFNDAVFLIRTDPITALSETEVNVANPELLAAPAPKVGTGLLAFLGLIGFMALKRREKKLT